MNATKRDIRTAEMAEIRAMRDLFAAAPAALGLRVRDIDGATVLLAPHLSDPWFNRVIGIGESQPARDSTLDAIEAVYREAGVPRYWIHTTAASEPAALGDRLQARSFTRPARARSAKFLRHAGPLITGRVTSLCIERATAASADGFATVAEVAYGMPEALRPWFASLVGRAGWHCVVAREAGAVVGVGALYVENRLGWLGVGGTLPGHRGRGAQTALLAERIRIAGEVGCTALATETDEPTGNVPSPSLGNIARAGFVRVGSRENFESSAKNLPFVG